MDRSDANDGGWRYVNVLFLETVDPNSFNRCLLTYSFIVAPYRIDDWVWMVDKFELYIPSELAYGDRGSPPKIGGGEVLIFQMEILAILGDTVPALTCDVSTGNDCNEREAKYTKKVEGWVESDPTKPAKEIKRIRAILSTPMSDDLRDWARRRENILSQFLDKADNSGTTDSEL